MIGSQLPPPRSARSGIDPEPTQTFSRASPTGKRLGQACRVGRDQFTLREVHRFANHPRLVDSVLRWDARALFAGILDGLRAAAGQAGPLDAVSVDGWAVDYGLLDGDGITATPGGVAGVDAARLYEATDRKSTRLNSSHLV